MEINCSVLLFLLQDHLHCALELSVFELGLRTAHFTPLELVWVQTRTLTALDCGGCEAPGLQVIKAHLDTSVVYVFQSNSLSDVVDLTLVILFPLDAVTLVQLLELRFGFHFIRGIVVDQEWLEYFRIK